MESRKRKNRRRESGAQHGAVRGCKQALLKGDGRTW
ncbi:hypothetical protein CLOBOL_01655 [Enterocloster bolteae ATCC BAA-613]|uniref:Uncharacterized protein n=1 Tax=Enterocloster bolteae (strain ATCC BAA-613 / DSM 15670 / CCUG 46953 / JCM 12243 / WAL 16351) TaxID=411902 RepID=A8RLK7_ENTBW|nr:hypothetical protein CLOBOL_01655 [Enterocloster bolteae ATCC BAA-613]